jgi:hypothetical protein
MIMSSSIRQDLRELIAKYGLPAVHAELQAEMKDIYNFLRQIYEPPKKNLVIPVGETIPDRIVTPLHKPITVVLAEPPPLDLTTEETQDYTGTQEEIRGEQEQQDPTLKEVIVQAKSEMSKLMGEKFSKAKHREEVLKKHKELTEKGIKPESLLTKENLTKWLGEGMSYMRIARECTGVSENEIAAIAKTFGLQSDIKKYIVMKKGQK